MPTIQQLLESQEKEFEKGFVIKSNAGTDLLRYTDANLIKRWHKQSIIALYEAEIEICEEELLKNYAQTYKNALKDRVSHYKQVIEELRK